MLIDSQTGLLCEEYFNELLALDKKRCERSKNPVLLMLANLSAFTDVSERQIIAKSMMDALSAVTRETDVKGWNVDGLVIGILFTEMAGKAEKFSRIQIRWQTVQAGCILEFRDAT